MILVLMAIGIILFLLFSRKGVETFTTINRLVRDPNSNIVYTSTGETVTNDDSEYIQVDTPENPLYYDYIYLHTPTNVRVRNVGTVIPIAWQYAYYPKVTVGGVTIK